jgi:glycosyltransferase involved in cell wall biosynthesis
LLVDDGSTDDSTNIALRYAERYREKVHYLEHPGHQNLGMSATRNLGIASAGAEYIAFLDADDVWLPHKLEQQVEIFSSYSEAAVLYGNTQWWHSWTGDAKDIQRDLVPKLVVRSNTLVKPPTLLTLSFPLGKGASPSLSNLMLRREVVDRVGGFEERFRGGYEDQAFLAKVYLKESVFVASESECWDRYRQRSDSCVAVLERTGQHHSVRLFFLNWLTEYLSEQGLEDPEVWRLLQKKQLITKVQAHMQKGEWKQGVGGLLVLLRQHPQVLVRACWRLASRVVRGRRRARVPPSE